MIKTTESQALRPETGNREFLWPVRVYYEDTDAGGVVYHGNYLKFMERARTEWLRALGWSQERLRKEEGIIFVVTAMDIRFRKPAAFDEQLDVLTTINNLSNASLTFTQTITNSGGDTVCTADVTVAGIDAASFKPVRIPDSIRESFPHVA